MIAQLAIWLWTTLRWERVYQEAMEGLDIERRQHVKLLRECMAAERLKDLKEGAAVNLELRKAGREGL